MSRTSHENAMNRIAAIVLLCQGTFELVTCWTSTTSSAVPSLAHNVLSDTPFCRARRVTPRTTTRLRWCQGRQRCSKKHALPDTSTRSSLTGAILPRLETHHLQFLNDNKYVVVPNFLPESMQEALRRDVQELRSLSKFKVARIGQDATNELNTNIRVAETCFVGPGKLESVPCTPREELYTILDTVRQDLVERNTLRTIKALDASLTELLYAYYPQGGFYRRHRDAVPGSASTLRKISLLLYLNKDWDGSTHGGHLRMHFDSGGDELPSGEHPNYMDIEPRGGTLVLFESDALPHEVLDTVDRDRLAVVGWYNRPVQLSDTIELGGGTTVVLLKQLCSTSTMMSESRLEDSVRLLIQLLDEDLPDKHSPEQATQLFLSSLHLLQELKESQHRIRRASNDDGSYPSHNQIPAITAVVNEVDLFRGLVRCLHVTAKSSDLANVTLTESIYSATLNGPISGRKRANSVAEKLPNKSLKTLHSPVPISRVANLQDISRNQTNGARKPTFNLPVLAASILYTAFEHLDHWPVQFMKAYADDCFGPRLWVDHQLCALFVANLAITHTSTVSGDDDDDDSKSDSRATGAATVATMYGNFDMYGRDICGRSSLTPIRSVGSTDSAQGPLPHRHSSTSCNSLENGTEKHINDSKSRKVNILQASISSVGEESFSLDIVGSNRSANGTSSSSGEEDSDDYSRKKKSRRCERDSRPSISEVNHSPMISDSNDAEADFPHTEISNGHAIRSRLYPLEQSRVRIRRVRCRFFGVNRLAGHEAITTSLADRLRTKSKQNSSLLQCLPSFTNVAGIRSIIASNLEKWLQSPALAGLARVLFTTTVNQMKCVDPPITEDLEAIDSLIRMHLKVNQLNVHIDNIVSIATRMPFAPVANKMYSNLLRELVAPSASSIGANTDQIKMIGAIHRAVSPHVSNEAMASALLTLLVAPPVFADGDYLSPRLEKNRLVRAIRGVLRALAAHLGSFDGCMLVESLLALEVSAKSWSKEDEEDKARLMFQCITLSVSPYVSQAVLSAHDTRAIKESLTSAKKLMLTWCCTEYGPHFRSKGQLELSNYFHSVLGEQTNEDVPRWLSTARCLLFLEIKEERIKSFMNPGKISVHDDVDWEHELPRIQLCSSHGGDLDDSICWIVLKAAALPRGIDSEMGILLLEHLFENCSRLRNGSISVNDPHLVWELYNLVQYLPSDRAERLDICDADDLTDVPRLAHAGLWWRVTMLALVMCSCSPAKIGIVLWQEHATLRALIKMVTSNRFRFPTVDCDEDERKEMKAAEQAARDKETKAAILLFLPGKQSEKEIVVKRERMSRRLQKQQETKELEEVKHRKTLLRDAQKSIILWDPDGPARKPPREAVDLLLSVENHFSLSNVFQHSSRPDFLLMTVGQTTRGAIERAYDWLIPIVSSIPDTIARLPSSASCFLLLRAYGTEGDERKQLKELSAPLLQHVQDSIQGKLGQADAVKAFDLLLTDVASKKPDRRRCARRVLHDSMAQFRPATAAQSWMMSILHLDHAKAFVNDAVKKLSTAAKIERGGVLRALVMALEQHLIFAEQNCIQVDMKFEQFLIDLICYRPSVCAEAIDTSANLRGLVVRVLFAELNRHTNNVKEEVPKVEGHHLVVLRTNTISRRDEPIQLPLDLLKSLVVLLSIWKDENAASDQASSDSVKSIVDSILNPESGANIAGDVGQASAVMLETGTTAVSIEFWIMLTKSRSTTVSRRAALSAPEVFLPRLLLCSGLPRPPLITMIDRLGRLGDSSENDKYTVYANLLRTADESKLDFGQGIERSSAILGRLAAYSRLHDIFHDSASSVFSTTFLFWLQTVCKSNEVTKSTKSNSRKVKADATVAPLSLRSVASVFGTIETDDMSALPVEISDVYASIGLNMEMLKEYEGRSILDVDAVMSAVGTRRFMDTCLRDNRANALDAWIETFKSKQAFAQFFKPDDGTALADLAVNLLTVYQSIDKPHCEATNLILKWVPTLSRCGKSDIWEILFQKSEEDARGITLDTLISKCVLSWGMLDVSLCRDWIISIGQNTKTEYDFQRVAMFLVTTCEQVSAQTELFSQDSSILLPSNWASSRDFVISAATIGILSLFQMQATAERSLRRRNSLPPSLTLFLLVGRCGKKQLRSLCDVVLEKISASDTGDSVKRRLELILLRLYLCYPTWMDLGSGEIRTILMKAAERLARKWVNWRACFDDKMDDMFTALSLGEIREASLLADMCRRHPLLILRKLPNLSKLLMADALIHEDSERRRDVFTGQNPSGTLDVKHPEHGRMTLSICHWGYSYTESLWITILDALSTMPPQVLFTCGAKVGLLEFLGVYIELVSVQLELIVVSKASRLKEKLSEVFAKFRQYGPMDWEAWLQSSMDGVEVRHLLVACSLVPTEEAIKMRKKE